GFRFVWYRPPKIDLDFDDLSITHGNDLGVPERVALVAVTFVSDEHAVAIGNDINKIESLDPFAVRPATGKIGGPIDPVVERTREAEVLGDQSFNRRAIFRHVRSVSRMGDSNYIIASCRSLGLQTRFLLVSQTQNAPTGGADAGIQASSAGSIP